MPGVALLLSATGWVLLALATIGTAYMAFATRVLAHFLVQRSPASPRATPVTLLKPLTYMNESGRAVQDAASFFKIGLPDIIVVHDEIELPASKMRVKVGGGIAGHNGLRSVSAHVGNDYPRVRVGVGHPGVKELVHSHVLNDFAKAERPWVEAMLDAIADNADLLIGGRDSQFQNKVHLALQAKGFGAKDDKPGA